MGLGRLDRINNSTKKDVDISNVLINVGTGLDTTMVSLDQLEEAPIEWNFYPILPHNKMEELIESISSIGIQHPIVVWERDNGKYMILSGHNRTRAFRILKENTNDSKYDKIHAVIKKKDEITEDEAREIIVDTNWVQRQLTPLQKAKSITFKYSSMKEKTRKDRVRMNINDIIAKEYDITDRQVLAYKSLLNIVKRGQELIDEGKLSIKAGVKISKLDTDIQEFIIDTFDSKLINKKFNELSPELSKEDINKLFIADNGVSYKVNIKLSYEHKKEFLKELQELQNKYNFEYTVKKNK